jgi:hypothetical protein
MGMGRCALPANKNARRTRAQADRCADDRMCAPRCDPPCACQHPSGEFRPPLERMNSPLGIREVRLRGLLRRALLISGFHAVPCHSEGGAAPSSWSRGRKAPTEESPALSRHCRHRTPRDASLSWRAVVRGRSAARQAARSFARVRMRRIRAARRMLAQDDRRGQGSGKNIGAAHRTQRTDGPRGECRASGSQILRSRPDSSHARGAAHARSG